jgi:hypothetical protein
MVALLVDVDDDSAGLTGHVRWCELLSPHVEELTEGSTRGPAHHWGAGG